jgi:uncharacterized Zn finger protein
MSWREFGYKPTRPVETDKGIKARSKRGAFAEHWWAQRWLQALERITDAGRLRRGQSYARKGQVLSIDEKAGAIAARVQGSRATPYKITIRLEPFNDAQWQAVIDALAERAIFSAQLLAGEMPQEIEEAFSAAGVSLFPDRKSELVTDCSCPDYANPCKHVAATHYILGEQFDEDPFLLFRLRGRSQEQITAALRARRTEAAGTAGGVALAEEPTAYTVDEPALPLEESLENFWRLSGSLEHFPTTMRPPTTPLSVLQRLGQPAFVDQNLEQLLRPLYEEASRQALALAFQDEGASDQPNTKETDEKDEDR